MAETDGTLVLVDEAGVSLTPLMPRTWAPKGKTPRIVHNVNGGKLSAIGGIDMSGEIYFRVHEESIKSEQVMEYLEQLLRHIDGYVIVLWDGLPAHSSNTLGSSERNTTTGSPSKVCLHTAPTSTRWSGSGLT